MGKNKINNVVVYDSTCLICSGLIKLLIRWDNKNLLKFTNFNSNYYKSKIMNSRKENYDTLLFIKNEKILIKSRAILEILNSINRFSFLRGILYNVPQFFLDLIYDLIAKSRALFRIKKVSCEYSDNFKNRFVD